MLIRRKSGERTTADAGTMVKETLEKAVVVQVKEARVSDPALMTNLEEIVLLHVEKNMQR